MATMWIINADSTPVLDGWGWDDYWQANDWIKWHGLQKLKYGLQKANENLVYWYWEATDLAASYDWKTTNSTWRNYAKTNGFLDALYSGLSVLALPLGTAADVVEGALDIGSAIGKNLKLIVTLIVIFLIIMAMYRLYNSQLTTT